VVLDFLGHADLHAGSFRESGTSDSGAEVRQEATAQQIIRGDRARAEGSS
jgi:hypothetical protein